MAVLITTGLALTVVFLGQLNFVAKLITMFFLNTYGMINLTAGLEKLIRNPSFRPQFNVPWPVALLGGLGCYAAMILIHPAATVIAVLLSYGIFFLLKRRSLNQRWGDLAGSKCRGRGYSTNRGRGGCKGLGRNKLHG